MRQGVFDEARRLGVEEGGVMKSVHWVGLGVLVIALGLGCAAGAIPGTRAAGVGVILMIIGAVFSVGVILGAACND